MEKFDQFLAKKLYHPLIIRWCQWRKCTQHTFANYMWVFTLIALLAYTPESVGAWIIYALTVIALIYCVQRIALNPSAEARGLGDGLFAASFRVLGFTMIVFTLVEFLFGSPSSSFRDIYFVGFTAAEYARTIKTIPPLETEEQSRSVAQAEV